MVSVAYMKNDKGMVTLHFIHLVIQDCIPAAPQVETTEICLRIYIVQTCSQIFFYCLHAPVL